MKLPKKITPCPIIESIVEVRFNSAIPSDAIFGIIYSRFKEYFPKEPIRLPILQLPEQIRNNDPNLIYKPHYKLSNDAFLFQVGPKSFALINKEEYVGWKTFSQKIKDCFHKIAEMQIIKTTKRFGLRYINFFEELDIYEKINLKLLLNEDALQSDNVLVSTSIQTGNFTSKFQISNNSKLKHNDTEKKGSVIDIDVYLEEDGNTILGQFDNILEDAHNKEKELFFGLLKNDFLEKFNPEYQK